MENVVFPPGAVASPLPPVFLSYAPTTTLARFDGSTDYSCVGVLIQVPDFDDTPAAVDANVYVKSSQSAGLIEIAPGKERFILCSNTNQLTVKRVANAGGAIAFIRAEVIRTAHA